MARMCSAATASMAWICAMSIAVAAEGHGQSGIYARVGLEVAQVQSPSPDLSLSAARHPRLTIGRGFSQRQAVELRINRIATEGTEPRLPGAESGRTLGIRATAVELGYVYRRQVWRCVEPRLGAGVLWIPTTYTWESDTPMETARASLFGIVSSAGVAVQLPGPFKVVGRGAYQRVREERSSIHIGLTGFRLEAGLELGR